MTTHTRSLLLMLLFAWPVLASAAKSDDARKVQRKKLAAVVSLEDQRTLGGGRLAELAADEDAVVRAAAVRAFGRLQEARGRPAIEKALADTDVEVRREAISALAAMPSSAPKLIEIYGGEKDPEARRRITAGVGRLGDGRHVAFLVARANEKADAKVRVAGLVGLGLLAKRRDGDLPDITSAQLGAWLKDEDSDVRYAAAYALMRAKKLVDEGALKAATHCAGDGAPTVRAVCVRALSNYGAKGTEALTTAAADDDWRVRVQAARGLGKVGADAALAQMLVAAAGELKAGRVATDSAAIHPVLVALDVALERPPSAEYAGAGKAVYGASTPVGKTADEEKGSKALGASHLRCRAAALWDRKRARPDRVRRCGAADYPKAYREPQVVAVLAAQPEGKRLKALARFFRKASPQGRVAVLGAIKTSKGAAVGQLVMSAIAEGDALVVAEAAAVAGKLDLVEAAGPLMLAYRRFMAAKEFEVVQSIFEALGALKSKAAVDVLEEHTFHPNRGVADAAGSALKKIQGHEARRASRLPQPASVASTEPSAALADPSPFVKATLVTTKGRVTLELHARDAMNTVKNFVRLAQKGYYDNLTFHRVVPDFVAQGGDPRGDGMGGPGYAIRCEINEHPYRTGSVGMALAGKDTGGSQFFITHSPQPHLDTRYTVFGRVTEGQDTVDALTVGDRILRIELAKGG